MMRISFLGAMISVLLKNVKLCWFRAFLESQMASILETIRIYNGHCFNPLNK